MKWVSAKVLLNLNRVISFPQGTVPAFSAQAAQAENSSSVQRTRLGVFLGRNNNCNEKIDGRLFSCVPAKPGSEAWFQSLNGTAGQCGNALR